MSNRKLSPKNVFGASTGFKPVASELSLQCSTNWAMKTHTLGTANLLSWWYPWKDETYQYYVSCEHTNEVKMWSSLLWLQFKHSQIKPENCFRAQLVEHCSVNATGSNPVEAPKTSFGLNLRVLKSWSQLRWSHLHFISHNTDITK